MKVKLNDRLPQIREGDGGAGGQRQASRQAGRQAASEAQTTKSATVRVGLDADAGRADAARGRPDNAESSGWRGRTMGWLELRAALFAKGGFDAMW